MRQITRLTLTALLSSVCSPALSAAQTKSDVHPRPHFGYFLPRAAVTAQVQQRLRACVGDAPPTIETQWLLTSKPLPDPSRLVAVDLSNGFLAKRATQFGLRADGTLESFNASRAGQGGAVLQSILKLGVSLASGGFMSANFQQGPQGQPARRPVERLTCSTTAVALLAEERRLGLEIGGLEQRISLGKSDTVETIMLSRLRGQQDEVRQRLTLSSSVEPQEVAGPTLYVRMEPLDYSGWFAASPGHGFDRWDVPGAAGWGIEVAPHTEMLQALNGLGSVSLDDGKKAAARLLYLRPVPATLSSWPCSPVTGSDPSCLPSHEQGASAASGHGDLVIPQWTALHSVSVGRGGLFGNRELAAKFDAFGAPLDLSYGSDSGAADMAATIDGGTAAVDGLQDLELQSLERRIKLEEARKKLRELQTAN